jgi:cytochrome c-type biogenesis protein CcmE
MAQRSQTLRIGIGVVVVLAVIAWLAVSGIQANKSYYVTITELQGMGDKAYTRHLRVAGNVEPGSIERNGTHAQFVLLEQGKRLTVQYAGVEPPPDTFKDNAQALAIGTYGHDGVFHAAELQAKCASKYAPAQKPGAAPGAPAASPIDKTASLRNPPSPVTAN